jgi:anti-sigma factor RsiW
VEHAEAQSKWEAYDRGALPREEVRAMNLHLKTCEACQSRVRLRRFQADAKRAQARLGVPPPGVQAQMARNRDLLVKILLLMGLAALIWKIKR